MKHDGSPACARVRCSRLLRTGENMALGLLGRALIKRQHALRKFILAWHGGEAVLHVPRLFWGLTGLHAVHMRWLMVGRMPVEATRLQYCSSLFLQSASSDF